MFEIKENFYLQGKPFQIRSGAIHYFRIVPEYWRDRLEKLWNMGCNTVETYIPWNFHEPHKGEFLWEGHHDICRFIETAQEIGLYMILRPSPYICGEWEFGGLPAWLLKDRNMRLRCCYPPYLDAVKTYYEELMPKLVPYQIDHGGNVILMQIENEYGYYGNDTKYLEFLRDTMRETGITLPFVTSDGPWKKALFQSGMVKGGLPTGNFGSSVKEQFQQMKTYMGEDKPLMCMEFWNGWFDAWGEEHHTTSPQKVAEELDTLMQLGHFNFYMFEGGTNFGFMNGKNQGSKTADVTSYDYDAPLTEDGQLTEKYHLFKEIMGRYTTIKEIPLSTTIRQKAYGEIPCTKKADLFSALKDIATPVSSSYPLTMEEVNQNYGYILYRLTVKNEEEIEEIQLEDAADRIQCYHNFRHLFTAFAENLQDKFLPSPKIAGGQIDLLCENAGRENFGTQLEKQRKGISGGVKINEHRCFGFDIFPLPLTENQLSRISFQPFSSCTDRNTKGVPAFFQFQFEIEELCDTFLDTRGFGKGCAFINGFLLGRFWEIGPQKRLYLPAPLLKKGKNTIILFETEGKAADRIYLADKAMNS